MTRDDAGVYPVREDTKMLLPFASVPRGSRFLEIGCGTGVASVAAAEAGARVVATDLNPSALRALSRVAVTRHLDIATVRTDLARGLGEFDRILANPPYLPTPPGARDPDRWVNLGLDGGVDGLLVTRRLFAELPAHLRSDGAAYLLVSSRQPSGGLSSLRATWMATQGAVDEVAAREFSGERLAVWRLARRRFSAKPRWAAPDAPPQ
jgi:HemK-related putative methylase